MQSHETRERVALNTQDDAPPAIATHGLTKRYGSGVLALDALTVTVRRGEVFGFLGPNGAGKTTTIRLLLDLIRPTAGRADIFGLDAHRDSLAARRHIGYLPGELSLYKGASTEYLLDFFADLRPDQVSPDYVHDLCRRLDLPLKIPFGQLSHGNRQKVGLVIAFMARPDLLILDEPTGGLDPLVQREVLDILRDARAEGRTVFFSSHVLSEVEEVCDRVGIIRRGKLVTVDTVERLRGQRLQRIRITFADHAPGDAFDSLPGVRVVSSTDSTVELEVTGEADPVVKAAARYRVVSLESERPSLEDIFMAYYAEPDAAPNRGDS